MHVAPESGAPLSEDRHYVGEHQGTPHSTHHDPDEDGGLLTTGASRSSATALARLAAREAQRHGAYTEALHRAVAYALQTLKSETDASDTWIWWALRERLARDDTAHDLGWLFPAADLRCPDCGGAVGYVGQVNTQPSIRCRGQCSDRDDRAPAIRDRIAAVYATAYCDLASDADPREAIGGLRVDPLAPPRP